MSTAPAADVLAVDAIEAARLLSVHPETVREMARRGKIPCLRLGRAIRFSPAVLREFVAKQSQASTTVSES